MESKQFSHVMINGKKYERIKAGDETLYGDIDISHGVTCSNCNAGIGQYHHWGCWVEECPVCLDDIKECDCEAKPVS